MKKFIDTNKKELLVSENLYHVDNYIDELKSNGIHVVSNVDILDYTEALEDITEAFLDIVDDLEEKDNYFRLPTQEELMQVWVDSGYKDMDEKFDILKHPNIALTTDGKGRPYLHGEVTQAVASITLGDSLEGEIAEVPPDTEGYELLSDEDLEELFNKNEEDSDNETER